MTLLILGLIAVVVTSLLFIVAAIIGRVLGGHERLPHRTRDDQWSES